MEASLLSQQDVCVDNPSLVNVQLVKFRYYEFSIDLAMVTLLCGMT